ncbi:MAG: M50 family metallopeptidase [Bifidobacteriaceae bacterium]|jgi:putative peptide zinc metalloprotease protein|nr:M50 family metallopeptidase [Bifidobacteriaceae bacterium]
MTAVAAQDRTTVHYQLTPGTQLSRDPDTGLPVSTLANSKSFRLGADLGRLSDLVAEQPEPVSPADLLATLGSDWDADTLERGLTALIEAGIVADGARIRELEAAGVKPSRFAFRPPCSLQWSLLDPSSLCRRLRRVAPLLTGKAGLVLSSLGAAFQAFALTRAPLPAISTLELGEFVLVGLMLMVLVAIHEVAHGVALYAAGGQPRRMGFMLFYLTPAFFCDVSDSWRLGRKARIDVALAGVASQCQVGVVTALPLVAGLPASGAFVWLTVFNLASAAANLFPLLKLDGYLALMAGVGVPNLRARAIEAWRGTLRRLVGLPVTPPPDDGEQLRWIPTFGALSAATTPALVATLAVMTVQATTTASFATLCGVAVAVLAVWATVRVAQTLLSIASTSKKRETTS